MMMTVLLIAADMARYIMLPAPVLAGLIKSKTSQAEQQAAADLC